jgi:hypothetical protein
MKQDKKGRGKGFWAEQKCSHLIVVIPVKQQNTLTGMSRKRCGCQLLAVVVIT